MHFVAVVITKTNQRAEICDLMDRYSEYYCGIKEMVMTRAEFIGNAKRQLAAILKSNGYQRYLAQTNGTPPVEPDPEEEFSFGRDAESLDNLYPRLADIMQMNDDQLFQTWVAFNNYEDTLFDAEGNYYEWCNPDSKFDYWAFGGRWKDALRLANGQTTNIALISDLTFRENKVWLEKLGRMWDIEVDQVAHSPKEQRSRGYNKEHLLATFETKENFIQARSLFAPGCYITPDGVWHEAQYFSDSDMHPVETEAFQQEFLDVVAAHQDHYMTVVDCHY